jgi:phospholipase C
MSKFMAAALLGLAATVQAATSLGEIKHVVMMMMENRSLQHVRLGHTRFLYVIHGRLLTSQYFGTMAGVRGFADPNVQINPKNNLPIWYQ